MKPNFQSINLTKVKNMKRNVDILDNPSLENSELGTRISELEKMIEMIEKANTELSSLMASQTSGVLQFQKDVSMCSAMDFNMNKKNGGKSPKGRITRSAGVFKEHKRIELLKSRLESISKKATSQITSSILYPIQELVKGINVPGGNPVSILMLFIGVKWSYYNDGMNVLWVGGFLVHILFGFNSKINQRL